MRARNNFTAIGHLGQAPEMRTSARSQKPVVRFSVAVNHVYVSDKGERQQQTEWPPIVVFREKLCDICMKYLRKGSEVTVVGHMHRSVWESSTRKDADGKPMIESRIDLVMDDLVMHGSSRRQEGDGEDDSVFDEPDSDDIPF